MSRAYAPVDHIEHFPSVSLKNTPRQPPDATRFAPGPLVSPAQFPQIHPLDAFRRNDHDKVRYLHT